MRILVFQILIVLFRKKRFYASLELRDVIPLCLAAFRDSRSCRSDSTVETRRLTTVFPSDGSPWKHSTSYIITRLTLRPYRWRQHPFDCHGTRDADKEKLCCPLVHIPIKDDCTCIVRCQQTNERKQLNVELIVPENVLYVGRPLERRIRTESGQRHITFFQALHWMDERVSPSPTALVSIPFQRKRSLPAMPTSNPFPEPTSFPCSNAFSKKAIGLLGTITSTSR